MWRIYSLYDHTEVRSLATALGIEEDLGVENGYASQSKSKIAQLISVCSYNGFKLSRITYS